MTTNHNSPNHNPTLPIDFPIINPITFYLNECRRIKEDNPNTITLVMNKTVLADLSGVTWQTVNKAEMGLYSSLPVKLVLFMARNPVGEADHSVTTWNNHYTKFIEYEMNQLKLAVDNGSIEATALFVHPANLKKEYADFTEWRKSLSYSQIDFCKTFLLHQAIISKYESGKMKYLPESLTDRLIFLGMSSPYINALEALDTHTP